LLSGGVGKRSGGLRVGKTLKGFEVLLEAGIVFRKQCALSSPGGACLLQSEIHWAWGFGLNDYESKYSAKSSLTLPEELCPPLHA
ncbi:hypothetical protein STEG23_008750, partial [Scotinomys teguina]